MENGKERLMNLRTLRVDMAVIDTERWVVSKPVLMLVNVHSDRPDVPLPQARHIIGASQRRPNGTRRLFQTGVACRLACPTT